MAEANGMQVVSRFFLLKSWILIACSDIPAEHGADGWQLSQLGHRG
jgi:hypothetical protein